MNEPSADCIKALRACLEVLDGYLDPSTMGTCRISLWQMNQARDDAKAALERFDQMNSKKETIA